MNLNLWDSSRGTVTIGLPMDLAAGASQTVAGQVQLSSAGVSPGATGADNVLAVFSIPPGSFAAAGNGLYIAAYGTFANNGNNKRVKIIFNPATAVVGATVGAGGTTIADTTTYSTSALSAFTLEATVFKYGAAGSNTQIGINGENTVAAVSETLIVPQLITANEAAVILIAVTGNAGSAVADILLNALAITPIS
jgi:hypothetical protein